MKEHIQQLITYIESVQGLNVQHLDQQEVRVLQKIDSKTLILKIDEIETVLNRQDSEGKPFIQVNMTTGAKLLLTESLIGFRPLRREGLDMDKLPNVVTTPDLVGVIEALEDSLQEHAPQDEVEVLKKLFYAVLEGAESIGFDLTQEKKWLKQINRSGYKASA